MEATKQQKEILEAVKKYKTIKINAFAGTGKSTTLKLIANEFKNKKILYLAFNASIKNEAMGKFPKNTFIKTTHGLAFSAIKKYTNINLNEITNYRAIEISKEFNITYNQALTALKIFENYCNNEQDQIIKDDTEHSIAKKMFDLMLIRKMKPTHGFYLKYYYLLLKQDQIPQFTHDIIMLDEAQDTNGVTLGIFKYLKSKVKIYVGDEHQQIYSFRGSKNILNRLDCDKKLYLSCSFRFSSSIALYANRLLKNFKNEKIKIDTKKIENEEIITNGFIARTNATIIETIASRCDRKKPFVTVRDPNEIFNLTSEVYYFLEDEKEKIKRNRFLKDFYDEEELSEYAKEVEDYELKSAIKVVKQYKDKIFEYKTIADKFYKAWQNKQNNGFKRRIDEILFLTTAHTAKGLEWDSVEIADDFTDFAVIISDLGYENFKEFKEEFDLIQNSDLLDEFNLFYVAITRAKKQLIKTSDNFKYLKGRNIEKLINEKVDEVKKQSD
jgi:superfamily I DNA/RNA helicase